MNDAEFWTAVDELFAEALALTPAERLERLSRFAGPARVALEVESLLSAHDAAGSELEPGAGAGPFPAASLLGRRLGPWLVLREVGRGGMGAVYEAVRDDDRYHKRVAIKTVNGVFDSTAVTRRFRQEQQILASLEHPNIGSLIDGGVTSEGLPYFVMEFVDGQPITQYCTERQLPLRERLDLFRQVCAAVEFAHRNLVVHRDLKPSNVFVTRDGTVKLLDFGIAKLIREGAGGDPTLTETGYRAFTTAYASPEQVRGKTISTASDIYSLGTMLYVLLAGQLPFDVESLTPTEVLARICETTPAPPSEAATADAALSLGFRDREHLARALRGELDDIVQSALRKEPERRYPTVAALSDDVKRFLQGQQVMARPDTWRYRMRTFRRRNPRLVLALGLAALSLGAGAGVATWQAGVARRERDRAQNEAARAGRVVSFVERLIATPTPGGLSGAAGDLLANALREAATDLAGDPLARAAISRTAAKAYIAYYQFERASLLLDTAIVRDRRHAGPATTEVGVDLFLLSEVANGQGDYPTAIARGREAVEILRQQPGNKPEDLSEALSTLGLALDYTGRPAEGALLHQEAAARQQAQPRSALLAVLLTRAGFSHEMTGHAEEAESTYRRALVVLDSLPERDPLERAMPEFALANLLNRRGAFAAGDTAAQNALRIFTHWLGPNHMYVGYAHASISAAAVGQGQARRGLAEVETALGVIRDKPISVMERTLIQAQQVRALEAVGRWKEAQLVAEATLAERRAKLAAAPLLIAEAALLAGEARLREGRYQEAEPLLLEADSLYRSALGSAHLFTHQSEAQLVLLYTAWGKPERSAPFESRLSPQWVAALRAEARRLLRGRG